MTRRATLYFPSEASTWLRAIRRLGHQPDNSATIWKSLRLYDELLDLEQSHIRIFVRDRSGKDWDFSPYEPFDYPPASAARERQSREKRIPATEFALAGVAKALTDTIQKKGHLKSRADTVRAALASFHELLLVNTCPGDQILVEIAPGQQFGVNLDAPLKDQLSIDQGPLRPPSPSPRSGRSSFQPPN